MPIPLARTAAAAALGCALVATVVSAALASPALAQTSADGPEGQVLTVSRTSGLPPGGETVTVTGSGYDQDKGIYVAYCVDNGPGAVPTPCGGGVDTTGSLGASHWISSNPPAYGEGLAVPYGDGGSFSVTLTVTSAIDDVECTVRTCAVVTRADHTRGSDRSQDVRIPISFGPTTPDSGGGTGAGEGGTGPDGQAGPVVITAGPVPSAPVAPVADELAVTRVSADDTAGRWWLASTAAGLAIVLALLLTGAVSRRRRRDRATPPAGEPQ